MGASGVDALFHRGADVLFVKILFWSSGYGYDLILVYYTGDVAYGLGKGFGVFLCERSEFADGGIFFEYYASVGVGEYLKRVSFPYSQCSSYFFWYYYSSEIIYSSYNACSFHIIIVLSKTAFFMCCYYLR